MVEIDLKQAKWENEVEELDMDQCQSQLEEDQGGREQFWNCTIASYPAHGATSR